jgi:hypothetical protein
VVLRDTVRLKNKTRERGVMCGGSARRSKKNRKQNKNSKKTLYIPSVYTGFFYVPSEAMSERSEVGAKRGGARRMGSSEAKF